VSDAEFLRIATAEVGAARLITLLGWALLWGATGQLEPSELRKKIQAAGVSRRASYVALTELKQIGEAVRRREGRSLEGCDAAEVLPRMAKMKVDVP
jgi:hypothetical protein